MLVSFDDLLEGHVGIEDRVGSQTDSFRGGSSTEEDVRRSYVTLPDHVSSFGLTPGCRRSRSPPSRTFRCHRPTPVVVSSSLDRLQRELDNQFHRLSHCTLSSRWSSLLSVTTYFWNLQTLRSHLHPVPPKGEGPFRTTDDLFIYVEETYVTKTPSGIGSNDHVDPIPFVIRYSDEP